MAGVIIGTDEYKIGVEERMLTKHFGSQYVDYQKRTQRIVPFSILFYMAEISEKGMKMQL